MAFTTIAKNQPTVEKEGNTYVFPLILVTDLFLLWGLACGLLDALNKHFQEILHIDKARSTLLQMAYFGAYFLIVLPAVIFMNRFGYKKGIIRALLLYTAGAFLFYPTAQNFSFNFFLLVMFILASGLVFLETAGNPYVTILGYPKASEFRPNLAQSFNDVGSFIGPIIAANVFFAGSTDEASQLDPVKMVYLISGVVVLMLAIIFWKTPLPEIKEDKMVAQKYSSAVSYSVPVLCFIVVEWYGWSGYKIKN